MFHSCFDFTSELFDPYVALHSNKVLLPYPKVKTYNNIAEYYSHTFLKKGYEADKLPKNKEEPRERNYDWYYDTLGLSELQRNYIRSTKKIKKRRGKKPVSVTTIPGSPLRSEKVTVCKSDFRNYCRRKYRSLIIKSAVQDAKSDEFQNHPSNSTIYSTLIPPGMRTESPDYPSALPFINRETSEFLPKLFDSTEFNCPLSLTRTVKCAPSELSSGSLALKGELPSTSCPLKTDMFDDSSNDSLTDDILILKVKSNLRSVSTLKNVYETSVTFQNKHEQPKLFSKIEHAHSYRNYTSHPHQTANDRKLPKVFKSGNLNSLNDKILNTNNDLKPSNSVHDPENTAPSQLKESSASIDNQKKDTKKRKKCSSSELKSQNDHKTSKHKKRQTCDIKSENNSNLLDNDQSQKFALHNISNLKKCVVYKENSSNDFNSNIQPIKKCSKFALKSQENVLDQKKTIKVVSPLNNVVKKIELVNSPVINCCTCKFPCGLSHLCTCGYYANAKEVLRKFKIPRKKK